MATDMLPVTGREYPTDRLFVRFPVNWVPVSSELHDPNRLRFTPWFALASFAIGDVADAKLLSAAMRSCPVAVM
jgi:hypothetical protein